MDPDVRSAEAHLAAPGAVVDDERELALDAHEELMELAVGVLAAPSSSSVHLPIHGFIFPLLEG